MCLVCLYLCLQSVYVFVSACGRTSVSLVCVVVCLCVCAAAFLFVYVDGLLPNCVLRFPSNIRGLSFRRNGPRHHRFDSLQWCPIRHRLTPADRVPLDGTMAARQVRCGTMCYLCLTEIPDVGVAHSEAMHTCCSLYVCEFFSSGFRRCCFCRPSQPPGLLNAARASRARANNYPENAC